MRGTRSLAAILAALGVVQVADWLRSGLRSARKRAEPGRLAPSAGEIRLDTAGARWNLIADLAADAGQVCWALLEGPRTQVAVATHQPGSPLAFALEPGPPGTYRFWIFASRRRRETSRSLSKRVARALAAGEFRI